MGNPLITIGESIHASIPKTGKIMRQLEELGPNAYSQTSVPLDYIKALIESQACDGADYIAVNLDAFGEDDPQASLGMMAEYVRLVRTWGSGVPVCIDSSDDDVLTAGLKQWHNGDEQVGPPLINSVKVHTMDRILPLKKDFDFAFVGLLVSEEAATGPGVRDDKENQKRCEDEGRALFARREQLRSRPAGAEDRRLQGLCRQGNGVRS
jgi:hypothetical protein